MVKNIMLDQRIVVPKIRVVRLRDRTDSRLATIWKDFTIEWREAEGIKLDGNTYVVSRHDSVRNIFLLARCVQS